MTHISFDWPFVKVGWIFVFFSLEEYMQEIFEFWNDLNKPKWLNHVNYLTVMGSRAYGSTTEGSDWDFYGFTTPPAGITFPHLKGDIEGFGKQKQLFNQLQLQGIPSDKYGDVDLTVYGIVRYFQLVMDNNPNMTDSLFVPDDVIVYMDRVGRIVRENRKVFLSQKLYHTFRGMAYSHMKRITSRTREGKRKEWVKKYGFDVKDASHVVRLMLEAEDFLLTGDADIFSNGQEILSIRNGEWSLDNVKDFFNDRMSYLEHIIKSDECVLPKYPDEYAIKTVLEWCLEEEYGSLAKFGYGIYKE